MSGISGREHIRFSKQEQQQKNSEIFEELQKHDLGRKPTIMGVDSAKNLKHKQYAKKQEFKIDFDDKSLVNGIILSEVLGKPRFLRRGRGRI